MKGYTVFNVEQIDGLPEHFYGKPEPRTDAVPRIERADSFFAATGATIRHGGNMAYYAAGSDHVQMPHFETFRDAESYYATLAHETTHWTKHTSRLNREFGRKRFGDECYAMEELVAELGSAFLSADLDLTPEVRDDHASYVASWLKVLKNDNLAHGELMPESRERLAALREGTRRTAHLLEQLLALARYDMTPKLDVPATSLDQCTKEVVADVLTSVADRDVDLGFEIVEAVFVQGGPTMLKVMIRNLIDNAIRHIPLDGRIDIGVYREGTRAIFQVEDDGPGIPEAELARIFEPFMRGSAAVEEGSGLGLSIVKRIVERLEGSVTLENVSGAKRSGLRVTVSIACVINHPPEHVLLVGGSPNGL